MSVASKKGTVFVFLAAAAGVAVALAPLPLEPDAHAVASIFAVVVVAWITEAAPLPVTSLFIPAALTVTGASPANQAFAGFGNPILFIFVGAFFIAEAMKRHGLDRRIAGSMTALYGRSRRPIATLAVFGFVALALSMWVSNTATTAILLPIFLGCVPSGEDRSAGATQGVLAIAYVSSVGGMGTLVGSTPNGITAALLEDAVGAGRFGFVEWTSVGLPMSILLGAVVLCYFALVLPRGVRFELPKQTPSLPMTRGERATLGCFLLAVAGWSAPAFLRLMGGDVDALWTPRLHSGAVGLLAATPLFLIRDDHGEAVLPWRDASRIDWGIIMLFAGGIALGDAMMATGLAESVGRALVAGTGVSNLWVLTAATLVVTIFLTEVCSNTAAASILAPLAISVATLLEVSPIPPALAVGLGASAAFMLPIATGPNAVAYGTGAVGAGQMAIHGLVLNVLCALTLFLGLAVLCPLLGFD